MDTLFLLKREILRFYRDRGRIIGTLTTPILFWVFLGWGLPYAFPLGSGSDQPSFLRFFFPGALSLSVLFTAIFSSISLIEDRKEGFLQGVIVSPAHPSRIALGKILGGAAVAWIQGALILCLAPWAGYPLNIASVGLTLFLMLGLSLCMTAVGFFFAWKTESVQGFHSVMNMVLFPMWLLSGSFFPLEKFPLWVQGALALNPLRHGVKAIQEGLAGSHAPSFWIPCLITWAFFGVFFGICRSQVRRAHRGAL